jgi:hypothetical protein
MDLGVGQKKPLIPLYFSKVHRKISYLSSSAVRQIIEQPNKPANGRPDCRARRPLRFHCGVPLSRSLRPVTPPATPSLPTSPPTSSLAPTAGAPPPPWCISSRARPGLALSPAGEQLPRQREPGASSPSLSPYAGCSLRPSLSTIFVPLSRLSSSSKPCMELRRPVPTKSAIPVTVELACALVLV